MKYMRRRGAALLAVLLTVFLLCGSVSFAETGLPEIDIDTSPVTDMQLASAPKKLNYFVGEDIDVTGAAIRITHQDGKVETLPVQRNWCGEINNTVDGNFKVYIEYPQRGLYTGESPSFVVTFTTPAVSNLKITKQPRKLTFYSGEVFETTGLEVTAYYSNGEHWDVTNEVTFSGFNAEKPGKQTITVSYKNDGKTYTTSYSVDVRALDVASVELLTNPARVQFIEGEALDIAGIVLLVTYNDGHTEKVTDLAEIAVDGYDPTLLGKQVVALSCRGFTVALQVENKISPAHIHTPGEYITVKEPTCTDPGTRCANCIVCGELAVTESIAPIGHTFGPDTVIREVTLEADGEVEHTCTVCSSCIRETVPHLLADLHQGEVRVVNQTEQGTTPFAGTYAMRVTSSALPEDSSAMFGILGRWTDKFGNEYDIVPLICYTVSFYDGDAPGRLPENSVCSIDIPQTSTDVFALRFPGGMEVQAPVNVPAVEYRMSGDALTSFTALLIEYVPVPTAPVTTAPPDPTREGTEKIGKVLLIGAGAVVAFTVIAVTVTLIVKKHNSDLLK